MKIYLACDEHNTFFRDAVKQAVDESAPSIAPGSIDLIFNPLRWGGDTGKPTTNTLRIMDSDIAIFDMTPDVTPAEPTKLRFNPGVMIEYGIVLAMEYPRRGNPWYGIVPKPLHRVFLSDEFNRTQLTPIIEATITKYSRAGPPHDGVIDRAMLLSMIKADVNARKEQRMNIDYRVQ